MAEVSRKPGRPKNPDLKTRREAEILAVATKLFAELGFANTQVQSIAERLGIGGNSFAAVLTADFGEQPARRISGRSINQRRIGVPRRKSIRLLGVAFPFRVAEHSMAEDIEYIGRLGIGVGRSTREKIR